jgi:hypothetical protein
MAIIVETGSGVPGANSYISQATFETYAETHGLSIAGKTDDEIESAIIRARSWIDNNYRSRWPGVRTYGSGQTTQWPRKAGSYYYGTFVQSSYLSTVTDAEGLPIPINSIPAELIAAAAEAAWRELIKPGSLSPDLPRGGGIKSVRAGSAGVEFFDSAAATTTFQVIDDLLAGLLVSAETSSYTGRAVRA